MPAPLPAVLYPRPLAPPPPLPTPKRGVSTCGRQRPRHGADGEFFAALRRSRLQIKRLAFVLEPLNASEQGVWMLFAQLQSHEKRRARTIRLKLPTVAGVRL